MELRQLRYFVAIAEEQSFTRASERLWITQPGLSTQIRKLESELGTRLFDRHARGVELTDAGKLVLTRAQAALAAVEHVAATGRDLDDGLTGRIRLGVATEAQWASGSSVLQQFADQRPGVELTLIQAYGGTLWRDLRDRRLDAMLAPAGYGSPDLNAVEVGADPWVVVIGSGHRLAGIGPVAAEELQGESIAVTGHRDGLVFDTAVSKLLDELGVECELASGGPGRACRTAAAGNEPVILTTSAHPVPARSITRPLKPPRHLRFELLWRDEPPSPPLREFICAASDCSAGRAPVADLVASA